MPKRTRRAILGRKLGMSQVYDDSGGCLAVTLIEAGPCTVLEVKSDDRHGYSALQVGFADSRKRPRKPQEGLFKKIGTAPKKFVREIPRFDDEAREGDLIVLSAGQANGEEASEAATENTAGESEPNEATEAPANEGESRTIAALEGVSQVDITGISKGRGFSGVVRRWNHAIGPKSHGSKSKRILGSVGMHQDPGRIIKGQSMPGQHGAAKVKCRNLSVVSMEPDRNLLVVKGAVPGPKGGYLYIEESLS